MSDLILCDNGSCEMRNQCLRYFANHKEKGSKEFLESPELKCENEDYKYFVEK